MTRAGSPIPSHPHDGHQCRSLGPHVQHTSLNPSYWFSSVVNRVRSNMPGASTPRPENDDDDDEIIELPQRTRSQSDRALIPSNTSDTRATTSGDPDPTSLFAVLHRWAQQKVQSSVTATVRILTRRLFANEQNAVPLIADRPYREIAADSQARRSASMSSATRSLEHSSSSTSGRRFGTPVHRPADCPDDVFSNRRRQFRNLEDGGVENVTPGKFVDPCTNQVIPDGSTSLRKRTRDLSSELDKDAFKGRRLDLDDHGRSAMDRYEERWGAAITPPRSTHGEDLLQLAPGATPPLIPQPSFTPTKRRNGSPVALVSSRLGQKRGRE